MGVTSDAIFGAEGGEPATPGSYGRPPRGFRLPEGTRLGPARLRVADVARSVAYYETVLGLRVRRSMGGRVELAPHGDDRVLLELNEQRGVRPAARRGRLGLFHFAILLPDRAALGRFVAHLGAIGVRAGAADHLVSEALYLQDPDNLGIEVYADRSRVMWQRVGRQLRLATDPVDIGALLAAAGDVPWTGMPSGTMMGHMHLHVGDIDTGDAFFAEALGFDRTMWSYPGALFLGAGGYHHHLGTNTWAGPGARATEDDEAGLVEWTIEVPTGVVVDACAASLTAAGHPVTRDGADALVNDPWGTRIRLRAS